MAGVTPLPPAGEGEGGHVPAVLYLDRPSPNPSRKREGNK